LYRKNIINHIQKTELTITEQNGYIAVLSTRKIGDGQHEIYFNMRFNQLKKLELL